MHTNAEEIRIDVHVRTDWIPLDAARLEPHSRSAVAIARAYDAETGEPFGHLDALGADPRHLVRGFHIATKTLLVGEPIVVEHRIALEGPGTWKEPLGGNYRARGRDDNFLFVVVPKGLAARPDPHGSDRIMMGGISTTYAVTQGAPQSYFHAVQRYAVVDAPGRYDLYCLRFSSGHDAVGWREAMAAGLRAKVGSRYRLAEEGNGLLLPSGEPSGKTVVPSWNQVPVPSPVMAGLPSAVREALPITEGQALEDFAHFEIELRPGTPEERAAMVTSWSVVAEGSGRSMLANRAEAARQAMWFARDDDFLPVLSRWLDADGGVPPQDLAGLAMRPSRAAVELLLSKGGEYGLASASHIDATLVPLAFGLIIERLDDPDEGVRSFAFDALARWSGQRFGAPWSGYARERPTLDEARALQIQVRAWWAEHRDGFVPVAR